MKKILFILILAFVSLNAQTTPKKYDVAFPSWYTYMEEGDSLSSMIYVMNPSFNNMIENLSQNTLIDTLYGVVTLTNDSTAYQLSDLIADTLDVYSIWYTVYTSGAVVFFGDASVTIDNGAMPTPYWGDAIWYTNSTLNSYLCSTQDSTKVRYKITARR